MGAGSEGRLSHVSWAFLKDQVLPCFPAPCRQQTWQNRIHKTKHNSPHGATFLGAWTYALALKLKLENSSVTDQMWLTYDSCLRYIFLFFPIVLSQCQWKYWNSEGSSLREKRVYELKSVSWWCPFLIKSFWNGIVITSTQESLRMCRFTQPAQELVNPISLV